MKSLKKAAATKFFLGFYRQFFITISRFRAKSVLSLGGGGSVFARRCVLKKKVRRYFKSNCRPH